MTTLPPPLPPSPTRAPAARAAGALRAPSWLQAVLIVGLLTAGTVLCLSEHVLWGTLLLIAGVSFGISYLLRRMVGDEYGRT